MSLVLVGFSRSGKSYFGKLLSKILHLPFIDTDRLIETNYEKDISLLHAEVGEKKFREMEKEMLYSLKNKSIGILATGGGIPCDLENADLLQTLGKVAFLELSEKNLWKRICQGKFPSFLDPRHPVTSFKTLYKIRYPLYQRCSEYTIKLDQNSDDKVINRLLEIIQDGK